MANYTLSYRIALINYSNYFDRNRNGQSPIGSLWSDNSGVLTSVYGDFKVNTSTNVNFSVGDGINASIVVDEDTYYSNSQNSNYMLLFSVQTGPSGRIIFALNKTYYVIKATKLNNRTYQLDLKRDILADNRIKISKLLGKIDRGILPSTNALFFNPEGNQFNQIKTHEILLKDKSNVGWIVGYLARTDEGQDYSLNINTDSVVDYGGIPAFASLPSKIRNAIQSGSTNTHYKNKLSIKFDGRFFWGVQTFEINFPNFFSSLNNWSLSQLANTSTVIFEDLQIYDTSQAFRKNFAAMFVEFLKENPYYSNMQSSILSTFTSSQSYLTNEEFEYLNGLVYKSGNDNYRVKVRKIQNIANSQFITISNNNAVQSALNHAAQNLAEQESMSIVGSFTTGQIVVYYDQYEITSELVYGQNIQATIPTTRRSLIDSPYDMFCIPFGNEISILTTGGTISPRKETSLALAEAIATAAGTRLYDLQILPYFPLQELLTYDSAEEVGVLNLQGLTAGTDFAYVDLDGTTTHVNVIIFPQISIFNFKIQNNSVFSSTSDELNFKNADAISQKVFEETTKTRLCSPNYSSMFEFSVGKNDWSIEYFNVSCSYKPQNPFIMISIDFKGLYGREYNDSRGLILGGDFSLPIVNSSWIQYEIQNKNYQIIFDRQIQNMDVVHNIERENMMFSGVKNLVLGAGTSALSSMMFGNPVSGIFGAAASAAGAGLAMNYNLAQNANLYAENKSYKIDMFNYQLGNIQALPYTLTKVSTLNNINKIFPFLEVFQASEDEKELLEQYFKYKSMRIETLGNIGYYMNPEIDPDDSSTWSFFQAEILRFDGFVVNGFIANQIYSELAQGVFDRGTKVYELNNQEDVIIN